MTLPPLERYLNWVYETAPTPSRDHGKENLPPTQEPRKLPGKMRPRRRKREHHQHPGTSGSRPETSQSPSPAMSASVKHPQPFQRPQHPIIIQHGLISWTRLNLAAYINRPGPASARNLLPDLVETISPGLTSPSLAHSDLIETTSLGRPLGI